MKKHNKVIKIVLMSLVLVGISFTAVLVSDALFFKFIPKEEKFSIVESSELIERTFEENNFAPSPSPIATPSSTTTSISKSFPTSSFSPLLASTVDIDLVNEGISFIPEKLSYKRSFFINQAYAITPIEAEVFQKINSGFYHGPFSQNDKIKSVLALIRNNGHEDAEKVLIKLIVDGDTLHEFTIDMIEKQSLKKIQKDVDFPSNLGKHRVEFQIDPEKELLETRYDNNTIVVEYEVIP